MKRIQLILLGLLFSGISMAQCSAIVDIVADGNSVTVTINGTGAMSPLYTIDWGDGSFDMAQTATHVYTNAGTYDITWVYADLMNTECLQSAVQQVIITGGGCTLDFTPISAGLTVALQASSGGTSAPYYSIDWGDGNTTVNVDQAFHQYEAAGLYAICVTMYDQDDPENCYLTLCQDVSVQEQAGACEVSLDVVVDGTSVTANATGSGAMAGVYLINWGDGTFSESASDTHVYDIAGEYEICVSYGDLMQPGACGATACQTVTAEAGTGNCTLEITATPLGLNVGLTVNASGAEVPVYSIDWGDGSPLESILPAFHTYGAEGTYQICVNYYDENDIANCQLNACTIVELQESTTDCTLELVVDQNGETVSVSGTGTGAVTASYGIDWGDGSFPTLGANGTHTYTESGTYEICMTYVDITNPTGCIVTECQSVDVVVGVGEYYFTDGSLAVMPNPLADRSRIEVDLQHAALITIEVYDLVGNFVNQITRVQQGKGLNSYPWNTANLSSGVYFVKVNANGEESVIKVIR